MADDGLTLDTLFLLCRKLEKYYGGAAELIAVLAWREGVGLDKEVPRVSAQIAADIGSIADDVPFVPGCKRFPICDGELPAMLVERIAQMDAKLGSVTAALRELVPYLGPNPPSWPTERHAVSASGGI